MHLHLRDQISELRLIAGVFILVFVLLAFVLHRISVHLAPCLAPLAHHLLKLVRSRLHRLVVIAIRLDVLLPEGLGSWKEEGEGRRGKG